MSEALKKILEDSNRVVFFGGAGVSTESGIPDFRSEQGLYNAMHNYGHPPETILSNSFFNRNPELFFTYRRENMMHPDAKPNAAHFALVRLEHAGKLTAVVTQNIDGLHQKAGSKTVFELHGSMNRNYCVACGKKYPMDYILSPTRAKGSVPLCEACDGIVRPDVVLFEEPLDQSVWSGALAAIAEADTLIVGGTSLAVYPAASLLHYFKGKNLVLINKGSTSFDSRANLVVNDSIGKVLAEAVPE